MTGTQKSYPELSFKIGHINVWLNKLMDSTIYVNEHQGKNIYEREISWLVARVWIAYDKLEEHDEKPKTINIQP